MNPEMMEALDALAESRGISKDALFAALAEALEAAYKKQNDDYEFVWVNIDTETGEMRVFAQELDEDNLPTGPEMDVTPDDFGRIAAQTVRQVMSQRIREVERELKYEEYAGREGDIVTGIIQQSDARYTLLDLGRVEALLPQSEQVNYERPEPGERVKAYIVEVRKTVKGPQIVVSRTHPGLIRRLFELEVPEIADGVVEIKACAREPGQRTKIAVWSNDPNVDPVGACVGARGARVRMVVNELRGEKIDIVPFTEDRHDFVMKALQPAKVKEVRIDEESRTAEVIVPDFQLSLAIGKEGQNARLATRLSGLRVDIRSETDIAEQEAYERTYGTDAYAEGAWIVDPETGEQMWQPSDGSPAWTLEQWEAAQAASDAEAVEEEVAAELDGDIAEAVEEVTDVIAAAEVDEEEAELEEVAVEEVEAELEAAADDALSEEGTSEDPA
ncbi:MAG TPA: transcription termination factor NusA [Microthrixaceae bacterium]|nr:transcription termination factor NusA [Microthrixaceae bacterium]HMV73111.1 transcription termination factor NusA [Microthrixaceae bacterium]HMY86919.1 transcription termination factor NusA [Microthrixaceae bacterium]HNE76066.1 transcription termination factor NusA [Microthrixaceae bacterium]HNJ22364.1 transcription termination factor NusA [Microthrixaceae bacterium]